MPPREWRRWEGPAQAGSGPSSRPNAGNNRLARLGALQPPPCAAAAAGATECSRHLHLAPNNPFEGC